MTYTYEEFVGFFRVMDPPVDPALFGDLFVEEARAPLPPGEALELHWAPGKKQKPRKQPGKGTPANGSQGLAPKGQDAARKIGPQDQGETGWYAPPRRPEFTTNYQAVPPGFAPQAQGPPGFAPQVLGPPGFAPQFQSPQPGFAPNYQAVAPEFAPQVLGPPGFAPQFQSPQQGFVQNYQAVPPEFAPQIQGAPGFAPVQAMPPMHFPPSQRAFSPMSIGEVAHPVGPAVDAGAREEENARFLEEARRREAQMRMMEEARIREEQMRMMEEARIREEQERIRAENERRMEEARIREARDRDFAGILKEHAEEVERETREEEAVEKRNSEQVNWGATAKAARPSMDDLIRKDSEGLAKKTRTKMGRGGKKVVMPLEQLMRDMNQPRGWDAVETDKAATTFAQIMEQQGEEQKPKGGKWKKGNARGESMPLEDFLRKQNAPQTASAPKQRQAPKASFSAIMASQDAEADEPPPAAPPSKRPNHRGRGKNQNISWEPEPEPEPEPREEFVWAPPPKVTAPKTSSPFASYESPPPARRNQQKPAQPKGKGGKKIVMTLERLHQQTQQRNTWEEVNPSKPTTQSKAPSFDSILEADEKETPQEAPVRSKGKGKKRSRGVSYSLQEFLAGSSSKPTNTPNYDSDDEDTVPRRPAPKKGKSMAEIMAEDEAEARAQKAAATPAPSYSGTRGRVSGPAKSFAEIQKEAEQEQETFAPGVLEDYVPGRRYEAPERKPALEKPSLPVDSADLFWGVATEDEIADQRRKKGGPVDYLTELLEQATGDYGSMREFASSLVSKTRQNMTKAIETVTSRTTAVQITDKFFRRFPK